MPSPKKALRSPRVQSGRRDGGSGMAALTSGSLAGWRLTGVRQCGEQVRARRRPSRRSRPGRRSSAAPTSWNSGKYEPQQSASTRHSKPRSLASRTVVCTQTSVVTPVTIRRRDRRGCAASARGRWRRTRPCRACRARPRPAPARARRRCRGRTRRGRGSGPLGPGPPIAVSSAAAGELGRRAVGQVGPVALARVDDRHAGVARGGEHAPAAARRRVASSETSLPSSCAEAARLEEVALHVDDHERGGRRDRSVKAYGCAASAHARVTARGAGPRRHASRRCMQRRPQRLTGQSLSVGSAPRHRGPDLHQPRLDPVPQSRRAPWHAIAVRHRAGEVVTGRSRLPRAARAADPRRRAGRPAARRTAARGGVQDQPHAGARGAAPARG